MAIIAKGMITLTNVNDAYSVLATPNVCAIKADFDGSNPVLSDAYCDISVLRGDVKTPFTIHAVILSHDNIQYNITGDDYNKHLALTAIPSDVSSGSITLEVLTEDELVMNVIFQYSVIKEAAMLDWIQEWENNKTVIGSTYLITPKLFVGKKITVEEDLPILTGVYIGPDSDTGAGVYGLKDGVDIFHLNEDGGVIGGWVIAAGGIETADGKMKILSGGSIISNDSQGNAIWGLYESGEATFANGKVQFHSDGDAEFEGKIISSEGTIGSWNIGQNALYSQAVCLDPANNYIGIKAYAKTRSEQTPEYDTNATVHYTSVMAYGGVYMFCNDSDDYGLVGYLPQKDSVTRKVFSIGSENMIAGWNFDESAIWTGSKMVTVGEYTANSNSITIGLSGLRSFQWRLENDGSGALARGKIAWDTEGVLNIGEWIIDDGIIKSSTQTSSYIHFDAADQSITLYNNNIDMCYEEFLDCGAFTDATRGGGDSSKITLSASKGLIEASAIETLSGNILPKTHMSPFGIHANYSGIKGTSHDKYTHYASIVGIGNGNKNAITWNEAGEETCVVGVYGKANNTSSAPAYGGYFENLKACGLVLSKRIITDDTTDLQIQPNDTLIVSTSSDAKTITLPQANVDGKIIIIQRLGTGDLRVQVNASSSQSLGVPSIENTYYSLSAYECAIMILIAYRDNGVVKYAWTIHKLSNSFLENA